MPKKSNVFVSLKKTRFPADHWVSRDTPGQERQGRMLDIGHVPGGSDIRAAVPECTEYKP